jgi:hypothetical protein
MDLSFNIKNSSQKIIAGINTFAYSWNIIYIAVLFVNEKYRL